MSVEIDRQRTDRMVKEITERRRPLNRKETLTPSAQTLLYISSGIIGETVYRNNGVRATLYLDQPGSLLGGPLWAGKTSEFRAFTTGVVFSIDRRSIENKPEWDELLFAHRQERHARLERHATDLTLGDAKSRTAATILEIYSGDNPSKAYIPQEDLATYIGVGRQLVNQTVKEFQQRGFITAKPREAIVVVDEDRLKALAHRS